MIESELNFWTTREERNLPVLVVNEILFTFEQTGNRKLVIQNITKKGNFLRKQLAVGTYTFTIKVKLKSKFNTNKVSHYYLLRFEQEFLGSSIIDFGQEVG